MIEDESKTRTSILANASTGVHTLGNRDHVSIEAARQNAEFFKYRAEEREMEQERLEREALEATENAAKSAATRKATYDAFKGK